MKQHTRRFVVPAIGCCAAAALFVGTTGTVANSATAAAAGNAQVISYPADRPPGVPGNYVSTPFGWSDPSCIHELADTQVVAASGSEDAVIDVASTPAAETKLSKYIVRGPSPAPETAGLRRAKPLPWDTCRISTRNGTFLRPQRPRGHSSIFSRRSATTAGFFSQCCNGALDTSAVTTGPWQAGTTSETITTTRLGNE